MLQWKINLRQWLVLKKEKCIRKLYKQFSHMQTNTSHKWQATVLSFQQQRLWLLEQIASIQIQM